MSGPADVDAALRTAAAAFETWRDTTPAERSLALLRFADAIEARTEDLVEAESRNTGKPIAMTRTDEVPPLADELRFFAGAARMLEGKSAGEYLRGHTSMIRREPVGVCAQVAPWNYPMMMAVWKFAPGPRGGQHGRAEAVGHHAGLDAAAGRDRGRVLPARRTERDLRRSRHRPGAGRARDPADGVHHRLGPGWHRGRAGRGRRRLKRVHLELGGKAPVVVFDDADIELAVQG